ncbi:MAG: hypothetical protein H0X24_00920 [Ktedonobacterales bacterium]|nr:hypothetical protein [Ktedonobacterales bacterium]
MNEPMVCVGGPPGSVQQTAAVPTPLIFTHSDVRIRLTIREPIPGPERRLVEQFARQIVPTAEMRTPALALFYEPMLTQGYPDLLIVQYDPTDFATWPPARLQLEHRDLRLIAFLRSQHEIDVDTLVTRYGGQRRPLLRQLVRLAEAGIIVSCAGNWSLLPDDHLLAVRHIMAVEAKMVPSQRVIEQAMHHWAYATEIIVLLPHAHLPPQIASAAARHQFGVWVSTATGSYALRPAVPRSDWWSYERLLVNEWIGRRLIADGNLTLAAAPAVDASAWLSSHHPTPPMSPFGQLSLAWDEEASHAAQV